MAEPITPPDARIAQLEAELAALRGEMQEFTYVVSHDLRAPLRHIVSFAQIIQEDAGPQLSSEVQGYLQTLTGSATHLTQMLDALLELSRVGTVPVQPVVLDPGVVVREVTEQLAQAHPGRALEWRMADGFPAVLADPALLRTALQQVLGNAVKFTARQRVAVITVDAVVSAHGVVLQVQDNGVGFAPGGQTKLCKPFARLHSAREFGGLGMGLAVARKCMERVGGALELTATEGAGCTVRLICRQG